MRKMTNSTIDDLNFESSRKDTLEVNANFKLGLSLQEDIDETIKSVGWQSNSCFYCIDFKSTMRDIDSIITRDMISEFPYPPAQGSRYGSAVDYPVKCIVTEWHVMFLFDIYICIYSKITKQCIYKNDVGGGSAMLGLCVDNLLQNVWMHSNRKIYYLEYSQESRNIWIDYLKINRFKDALQLCKEPKYQSLISGLVADQIFDAGNYERSVEFYAKSNKSFEEVALKFLNRNLHYHLCRYLELFLERIKLLCKTDHTKDYKPQKILLCTWIVELKLNEINKIKIKSETETGLSGGSEEQKLILDQLEKDFWKFIDTNFPDRRDIEQVLQSHGKINECMKSPKGKFYSY